MSTKMTRVDETAYFSPPIGKEGPKGTGLNSINVAHISLSNFLVET